MNFNDTASILAIGAICGGLLGYVGKFWSGIKAVYTKLFSMIISTAYIEGHQTRKCVLSYLVRNFKRSSTQERTYSGRFDDLKNGKHGLIGHEIFGRRMMIFWSGWLPIIYHIKKAPSSEKVSISFWFQEEEEIVSIYFIRNTFDISDIIKKSIELRNQFAWNTEDEELSNRFFIKKIPCPDKENIRSRTLVGTTLKWYQEGVYELLGFKKEELGKDEKCNSLENLVFPPNVNEIIDEAIRWRDSKDWYKSKGIAWKRGWLLYGPPGTGKTAVVRAIAQSLNMPLFVFSLGELENGDLQKSWDEMQANSPCFALFEDFDNVFRGRENIYNKPQVCDLIENAAVNNSGATSNNAAVKTGKLTFDCLLNCIDGVDKNEGIFTIITTNRIEHIDTAMGRPVKGSDGKIEFLSTRPGRIDRAIELSYMRREEKIILAERILSECTEVLLEIKKHLKEYPDEQHTPSQFQDRCVQMALKYYWQEKDSPVIKMEEVA